MEKNGDMALLVLKLLENRDQNGYQMIEELKRRSDNTFHLKAGTLYPLLHGLEEKGFVTAYEQESGGKSRRYYHLTKEGGAALREKEEGWVAYVRAVNRVLKGGVCFG